MRLLWLILIASSSFWSATLTAKVISISPEQSLEQALSSAQPGDELILQKGIYQGNFVINVPMTLKGEEGAEINAGGNDHALLIKAENVTISDLRFRNWGDDLTDMDAGVFVQKQASNVTIRNSDFKGDGFGIWLDKTHGSRVINNIVEGNPKLRSADRGNGIQLSLVEGAEVRDNRVSKTRDGLYVIHSNDSVLENNTVHDLRYGIHYMYSHSNRVVNNTAYNTRAGYALMSSRNLVVAGNQSRDSQDYGLLMNYITSSEITNNRVERVWSNSEQKVVGGDGKSLFIYNSLHNTISNNLFADSEIGIHLTAGSEENKIFANSFIDNVVQVKYVSSREQEWSQQKQGNYWSNYLGWDMDNSGTGDQAFEPNDSIDKLLWEYPEARVLMDSPAVLVLRWVQRQFPVFKPQGVKDSYPLMAAPHQKSNQ
ncbi:nitrous oxide reductase family maturation protein NosD [Vibrio sp. HN007]|uniref:nitrous oxide reductase family maturation protein NosD n=1 Tax=Vibrio iocasae TaxID=3098914 RepID=UPI0035D45C5A